MADDFEVRAVVRQIEVEEVVIEPNVGHDDKAAVLQMLTESESTEKIRA